MIQFGRVKSFKTARVVVELTGVEGNACIEALLMQPCSASGPRVWFPPATGDIVVVWVDDEHLDNSVVLGVVYPDGKNPPRDGGSEIAMQADKVYLGDDVNATEPCPRDDRLQSQLDAIKSELDGLTADFNGHMHTVATVTAVDAAAIVAAATSGAPATTAMVVGNPLAPHTQTYSVGQTASDSVEVK